MKSLLVGLTGGMAGGKSTVAAMLAAAGCEVIDADRLVAELYAGDGAGAAAVREIAGPEVLTAEGAVDRPALAARFFSDAVLRRAVEAAVHPLVRQAFEARAAASQADIVVLEATLLVEAGFGPAFDLVVTVEADSERRLERAIARGLTAEQARARLVAQGDGAARRAGADLTIDNDGTLAELQAAVDRLLASCRARLAAQRAAGVPD
jgi:dephospho-CoA kinase